MPNENLENASANPNEAFENLDDSALILGDQDETLNGDDLENDDTMGANGGEDNALSLENEPDEFVRGEVDVKTQMDRTTARADYLGAFADTRGATDADFGKMGEGAGRSASDDIDDLNAGDIPLSIDEAALQGEELREKTLDQLKADEAQMEGPLDDRDSGDFVSGADHPIRPHQHGAKTGAFTDIGAGRSGVTRRH